MLKDIKVLYNGSKDEKIVASIEEYQKFVNALALVLIKSMEDYSPMCIKIGFDQVSKKFKIELEKMSAIIL